MIPLPSGTRIFLRPGRTDGRQGINGLAMLAESSATLYSIVETAKANGHEPFFYLYNLFTLLPLARDGDAILALLPFNVTKKQVLDFAAVNWLGLG